MTDNNLEGFETSATRPMSAEEAAQRVDQNQSMVLQVALKNHREGLQLLQSKVDDLNSKKRSSNNPKIEARLRDIERALGATLTTLEAMSTVEEVVKHDLIACIQNIEGVTKDLFRTSAHIEVLIALLRKKDMITEEDLEATWNEIVPQQIQAMKDSFEAAKAEATEPPEGSIEV